MLGVLRASSDLGLCLRSKWKPQPLLSRCLALAFAIFMRAHPALPGADLLPPLL